MCYPTALLVVHNPTFLEAIKGTIARADPFSLDVCPVPEQACPRVGQGNVVLVLAHLPAGGDEAGVTRLLWAVARTRRPCATVVLADAYHEQRAAGLLRAGAADFLALPDDLPKLAHLADALTHRLAPPAPPAPAAGPGPGDDDLGGLLEQVRRVAPQQTTVLLTGETGTGKTRLARLIHELSPRRGQPFLVVDCGALSASLAESELFGHARGAFTGADRDRAGKLAAAGAGTLLLDEVNSLPLPLQAKLLRAADERLFEPVGSDRPQPVRARLVAASNAPLEAEVAAGRFRADLYYRLNVVGFYLPPLRERAGAVAALAGRFLAEFAGRDRPDVAGLSAGAVRALGGYGWPGNVRELRNVVERAVALCQGPVVERADLPEPVRCAAGGPAAGGQPAAGPVAS